MTPEEDLVPRTFLYAAAKRIAPYVRKTPLTYDPQYKLYLKWENRQVTGSFKARGAFNKMLALSAEERQHGVVTASAGNHGQGVALAAQATGARATIFASQHAVPTKVEAMHRLGAEVRLVAGGYGEAEAAGLEFARSSGAVWVSPYNDPLVVAGQAVLGLEILEQLPPALVSVWVAPAGGGGLVSGVGLALESAYYSQSALGSGVGTRPRLVAVQSEASSFLHALYHAGSQEGVVELPSLADGLAGPVEHGSLTIPLTRYVVDDFVLVTEDEIAGAIALAWRRYGERIEGSAAAALAAVWYGKVPQRPALVVISGGNIQPELHTRIVHNA